MIKGFDNATTNFLEELKEQILSEYDAAEEPSVLVKLLPLSHNVQGERQYEIDKSTGKLVQVGTIGKKDSVKSYVVVHEATPSPNDGSIPTKPPEEKAGRIHYEKILYNLDKNKGFGGTVGYHAIVGTPEALRKDSITIFLPLITTPEQTGNKKTNIFTYGIERLCGDKQNYHYNIAVQAMLTAFVLKQLGYSPEEAKSYCMPHMFFSKAKKKCPARMLYASELLEQKKKGKILTAEMKAIIAEYVPWEVFSDLVEEFAIRDRYPEELRKKFIFDKSDQIAYEANPELYDYEQRKASKSIETQNPFREYKEYDPEVAIKRKLRENDNER